MGAIPDAGLGAVIAALFAALLSLLGLIISKENKTSEFRQAWTDALRSELAALIGHLNAIHGTVTIAGTSVAAWQEAREDIVGINRCAASIRLRLNPKEPLAQSIFSRLDDIERRLRPDTVLTREELSSLERGLLDDAQKLLKKEWLVVRGGERTYRVARGCALVILVLTLAGVVIWLARTRPASQNEPTRHATSK